MARTNAAVVVGVTPVLIAAVNPKRVSIAITNNGTVPVYLGDANVTMANGGVVLPVGAIFSDDRPGDGAGYGHGYFDAWYGVSGSAAQDVRVVEE